MSTHDVFSRATRASLQRTSSGARRAKARRRGILLALIIAGLPRPTAAQLVIKKHGLFVGKIEWTDYVTGPNGSSKETVVAVVDTGSWRYNGELNLRHVVSCHVVFVEVDQGQSKTTVADGPGLLEIFFQKADEYSFTAACPNAIYTPPRQAEWSHAQESSTQRWQPKVSGQAFPEVLTGGWSVPHPASDALNGVGGTLTLTWSLCSVDSPKCVIPSAPKSPP